MIKMKKFLAGAMAAVLMAGTLAGCGGGGGNGDGSGGGNADSGDLVTLTVFSERANYSGEMQGWFAKILADKFNVKFNIIPSGEGVFDTRMVAGDLGDIIVWGSDDSNYQRAVEEGMLLDWEEDNILQEYGPYMWEHLQDAFEKNKQVSAQKDDEGNVISADTIYGFAASAAASPQSHDAFLYTWDIRWDLYKQLGYPKVDNLDDLMDVLEDMQELCPTDDKGNKTYAMSLWPDWDGNMVMYVKSMATAYYGYDEFGFGHYNVTNGEYYDALSDGSPYLEMLAWFNELYRRGLLDPDSMTQTYNEMIAKVQNGGVLFSIFNYAGSQGFNNQAHYDKDQIMMSLKPTQAVPIVYGLSSMGGNQPWSIGAKTQYPELCMEILDWLCTPEGRLTIDYGPKGLCWDYDENGKTYLTEFGLTCVEDRTTVMPEEWGGKTFNDGAFQPNQITWAPMDTNPESGEPYNREYWASFQVPEGRCPAEVDWREYTGCTAVTEYLENNDYVVDVVTTYSATEQDDALETKWSQVATCIKDYSWRAIYAETEEEFDQIVKEMYGKAMSYGYRECVEYQRNEAARKNALQEPLR